jgi:hypothetical protein
LLSFHAAPAAFNDAATHTYAEAGEGCDAHIRAAFDAMATLTTTPAGLKQVSFVNFCCVCLLHLLYKTNIF